MCGNECSFLKAHTNKRSEIGKIYQKGQSARKETYIRPAKI